MSEEVLECDLVVVSAGMAGLSAAGRASENGAKVVLIEKAPHIGCSAIMSGGILWTACSAQKMDLYGSGDPVLGEVVRRNYPSALRGSGGEATRSRERQKYCMDMAIKLISSETSTTAGTQLHEAAATSCMRLRVPSFSVDARVMSWAFAPNTWMGVSTS
jgi:flavin-dependent dehydrogenase